MPPESFAAVPLNRFLDLRLHEPDDASGAVVRLDVREQYLQENGVVHGGLITTIADTASVYAVLRELPPESRITGIELKMNFLRPATAEGPLEAVATALRVGRRVAVAEAEVRQGGKVVAKGTFTYLR